MSDSRETARRKKEKLIAQARELEETQPRVAKQLMRRAEQIASAAGEVEVGAISPDESMIEWSKECADVLARGGDVGELVSSLSRRWVAIVEEALEKQGQEPPWNAIAAGPRGILALSQATGSPKPVWASVTKDPKLPPTFFRLSKETDAKTPVGDDSRRCLSLCCAAPEARDGSGWCLLGDAGRKLCDWAAAECRARYEDAEDEGELARALLVACGVHSAFRGGRLGEKRDVAWAVRGMEGTAEEIGNALISAMNRATVAAEFFCGTAAPCVELVADLVEPPCMFPANDMRILVDVALREIVDAPRGMAEVRSFTELLSEVVQSEWYSSERHRESDVIAVTAAAAESFGDPGISFLAREISTSLGNPH